MTNETRANVNAIQSTFPSTVLYNKPRLEIWIVVGRMIIPGTLLGRLSVMNDVNCVDAVQ